MKKVLCSIIFFILASNTVSSQNQTSTKFQNKNSAQLELGGYGLFYSINYERILLNSDNFKTASQLGISYYPPTTGVRDLWIPFGINEILSIGKHHIEAGLGYTLIREAARDQENNPLYWFWSGVITGRFGYRFQKPNGRFIFRVAFTPLVEYGSSLQFHPSAGVAVGYSF